jgi:dTDP-4-dehydrorhamnose 3,5-epimerase
MDSINIFGVEISELKIISNELGSVLHMLRNDSTGYLKFGECYFSEVYPYKVKAWKKHKIQTQNITVPVGKIKLVIFDDRNDSITKGRIQEIFIGRPDNYKRVTIPPGLWYGFASIGDKVALLVNCADQPHDPNESISLGVINDFIPYVW